MDIQSLKAMEPIFGAWTVVREIGEGSFGKVFEIERRDDRFGKVYKAALKVITIPQNKSEIDSLQSEGMKVAEITDYYLGVVQDVINEYDLMVKLKGNSYIVSCEDYVVVDHEDGVGYDILIRMELLTPLVQELKTRELDVEEVIKLGIDLCKALEYCQMYNIIHRDIKPENIFISDMGSFKLGDFGISRTIEKTNATMSKKGTYTYMAPEVFREKSYGKSVDIYSIGMVMYRFLNNNRAPFLPQPPAPIRYLDKDNAMVRRMNGEPVPAPVNGGEELTKIILKACEYEPENRYSEPRLMRLELEKVLSDLQKPSSKRSENHEVHDVYDKFVIYDTYDNEKIRTENNNTILEKSNSKEEAEKTVSIFDTTYRENNNVPVESNKKKEVDETVSFFDTVYKENNNVPVESNKRVEVEKTVSIFDSVARDNNVKRETKPEAEVEHNIEKLKKSTTDKIVTDSFAKEDVSMKKTTADDDSADEVLETVNNKTKLIVFILIFIVGLILVAVLSPASCSCNRNGSSDIADSGNKNSYMMQFNGINNIDSVNTDTSADDVGNADDVKNAAEEVSGPGISEPLYSSYETEDIELPFANISDVKIINDYMYFSAWENAGSNEERIYRYDFRDKFSTQMWTVDFSDVSSVSHAPAEYPYFANNGLLNYDVFGDVLVGVLRTQFHDSEWNFCTCYYYFEKNISNEVVYAVQLDTSDFGEWDFIYDTAIDKDGHIIARIEGNVIRTYNRDGTIAGDVEYGGAFIHQFFVKSQDEVYYVQNYYGTNRLFALDGKKIIDTYYVEENIKSFPEFFNGTKNGSVIYTANGGLYASYPRTGSNVEVPIWLLQYEDLSITYTEYNDTYHYLYKCDTYMLNDNTFIAIDTEWKTGGINRIIKVTCY